jgi:hypothetical protein
MGTSRVSGGKGRIEDRKVSLKEDNFFNEPCGDSNHRVLIRKNGTVAFVDHPGVPFDILAFEAETLGYKGNGHCGCIAGKVAKLYNSQSSETFSSVRANTLLDTAFRVQEGIRRDRRARGAWAPNIRRDLVRGVLQREFAKTDLAKVFSITLGNIMTPKFGETIPFRDNVVEVNFEAKHWARLQTEGKTVIHFPPGKNGELMTSLALGEIPSGKGYPIFNVIKHNKKCQYALCHQVRGEWHWRDWLA